MGTRNLTCVFNEGEYKVAQYGQWDGYPSGQGLTILNFLKENSLETFKEKLKNVKVIKEETLKELWVECGADPDSEFVDMEVSDKFAKKYPNLHRDCAAGILQLIQDSTDKVLVQSDLDFAKDSLFCEWCYVIDLDKNTFEVYDGFVKSPLAEGERFKYLTKEGETYYPVRLLKSFDLNNLPNKEEFVKLGEEEN